MPSELASARAKITEEKERKSKAKEAGKDAKPVDNSVGEDAGKEEIAEGTSAGVPAGGLAEAAPAPKAVAGRSSRPRERVSKRVRSQMITSEKKTDRRSKRSSVEYCLLAGALSCTAQHPRYTELLKTEIRWEQLRFVQHCLQPWPALSRALVEGPGSDAVGPFRANKHAPAAGQTNHSAFLAPSSLNSFIENRSRHNSGPRDLLETFLLHVALNTEDVFDRDTVDSLTACFIDGEFFALNFLVELHVTMEHHIHAIVLHVTIQHHQYSHMPLFCLKALT